MTPSINAELLSEGDRLPEPLLRIARGFIGCWRYRLLRPLWVRALVLLFIAGYCLTRAVIGLKGTQYFSHDAFMLLDGAWRMMNGQRPHIDFYSHLGVLTYLPTLAGFWMTHGKPAAFGYGQGLTGLILGVWAYFLSRGLLSDVTAVLMSLAVTLMAASPSVLGFPPFMVAPAMTYNRCAYAVLALILTETLVQPTHRENRNPWLGGVSTGTALAVLLFLKITFFVIAGFFVVGMVRFGPRERRYRLTALAIAFVAVSLVCSGYFGFNLRPMLHDLVTVAASKHFKFEWYMFDAILEEAGPVLALGLMGAWLLFEHKQRESAFLLAIGSLAVCAMGLVLILGNYEQSGFPLAVFLAIIVVDRVTSQIPFSGYVPNISEALVLLLGSIFIFVFLVTNTLALAYAVKINVRQAGAVRGLDSPILATFVPVGDRAYADFVDDGLALVRKYRRPGESIMSLDFTNPFSYGLGAKPAPGGNTVMQYRTTFNETHLQSAESLFGSADLVALPQPGHFSDDSLEYSIVPIYGSYLESHFKLLGESKGWKLYRRNGA